MTQNIDRYAVGTIVKVFNVDTLVMISGYLMKTVGNDDKIWDYAAFPYPWGLRDKKECIVFDHKAIEDVLALGYQDKESIELIQKINKEAELMSEDSVISEDDTEAKKNV